MRCAPLAETVVSRLDFNKDTPHVSTHPYTTFDHSSTRGAQFTSAAFTSVLKGAGVAISMDGKGRWVDNVFVERLWRSVKYEEVYLYPIVA